jgi:hypothetical protein
MNKEILRVEKFDAVEMVPASRVREALRTYPDRTTVAFIVAVFATKTDPQGDPRNPDIVRKFRVAFADSQGAGPGVITYSSCVDSMSNMIISAIAPAIDAHQTSIDVGGAYYHGTPPSIEEGGRLVFAHMPYWLPGFGTKGYAMRLNGERQYLYIKGNMPGRCDAGRIWQTRFDRFILGYGMHRLNVDLRVFTMISATGVIFLHDHVDDTRITTTSSEARRHFHTAWALEFGEKLITEELSEDFTGIRHHRSGLTTMELSCEGVIKRLIPLLSIYPQSASSPPFPLPENALRLLNAEDVARQEGQALSPIQDPALLQRAQQILGTIGFAASTARPDVNFAYSVLARYVNSLRFTSLVERLVIRIARYLISTIDLHLTIDTPQLTPSRAQHGCSTGLDLFTAYVDSSHGNGPEGRSYGGFVLLANGARGGAIAWKTILPHIPADSTGGAELILCSHALKIVTAVRMLQTELMAGVAPTTPTLILTDAMAVVEGAALERLNRTSRWLSTRYAMLRWGINCQVIRISKLPATENVGDLQTKPVVGLTFVRLRSRLMGLQPGDRYYQL